MRSWLTLLRAAERSWFAAIPVRLTEESRARVLGLVNWREPGAEGGVAPEDDAAAEAEDDPDESVLALIKSMPGNVSLESLKTERRKLLAARGVGLPPRLFADVAPKVLASWRGRCAVESPSHLRRRSADAACTLLAAYVHERTREITDDLIELLIATVHRIDARAHKKVTEELVNAFKRVDGKENLLFKIAEAALSGVPRNSGSPKPGAADRSVCAASKTNPTRTGNSGSRSKNAAYLACSPGPKLKINYSAAGARLVNGT
jgi:hypothetical protein